MKYPGLPEIEVIDSKGTPEYDSKGELWIGGDRVCDPIIIKLPGYTIKAWSSEWGGITITPASEDTNQET